MPQTTFSIDRDIKDGLIHQCSNQKCLWVIRSHEMEPKCPLCQRPMIRQAGVIPKLKGGK